MRNFRDFLKKKKLKHLSLLQGGVTKSRRCGLKSEERDCDASDRAGTDFDDGICAYPGDLENKYVPLQCFKCTGSAGVNRCERSPPAKPGKETCPEPAAGTTAACLTNKKGLENTLFRFFRCCCSRQQPD